MSPSRADGILFNNKDNVFFQGRDGKSFLKTHDKILGFSKLRNPPYVQTSTRCHSVEFGVLGTSSNANTLAAVIIMSNKLSFVSDPGVLCPLSSSMTLRQTNLLAYMWGYISEPSQFLTGAPWSMSHHRRSLSVKIATLTLFPITVIKSTLLLKLVSHLHSHILKSYHCF